MAENLTLTRDMYGYHGNYLRIDVRDGSCRRESIDESVLRRVLGGSGLGTYLLLREGGARTASLAPEAPLVFAFSPLVGSPVTTSAKFAVVNKSPLTHRINDSLASSGFAISGKMTGSDAIVIVGRASKLSLLVIDEQGVRLEPADDFVGMGCSRVQDELRARFGPDYCQAVIGPAGERRVPFATISHDGRHAGRGGGGAVLGAKNLKALIVRGSQRVDWARPEALLALSKQLSRQSFGPATAKYRELGTASNLLLFNRLNSLPTRNFQSGSFEGAGDLAPETISETRKRTRAYCAACTIGCEHLYDIQDGSGEHRVRLEYENLFALGPLCGVDDSRVVLEASKRCDEYGLDTVSTGGTIAFAMECAANGWFDAPQLRFGDGDSLLTSIDAITTGEGIGAQLALGSRELALRLGPQAMRIAPHVKGLELPGYEPRSLQTMALGLAVGSRGADHNRSGAYEVDFSARADRRNLTSESAMLAVETEDRAALLDSLILCKFLRGVFEDYYAELAELLGHVTGWDVTADEMRHTSARIVTLKKIFNIEAGWKPVEDTLPPRILEDPLPDDSGARLGKEQLKEAIGAYNTSRGWTREGWVPPQRLTELELTDLVGPQR